jgi:hypothetical protein
MLIKITFKNLVNCNPIKDSYQPMISLRIQDTEIIIPQETFRWRVDGSTVVLEVAKYELQEATAEQEATWEFETIAGYFPSIKFQINPDLISEIKEIV